MSVGTAIIVDIGKTLSKVTLWSRDGELLDRQVRPNERAELDGIRRLDIAGIGSWLIAALAKYRDEPVSAIMPVGHGAGIVALLGGELAFPPFDYEQPLPGEVLADYRKQRDAFAVTGSPALPEGLNIGSQLHWMERLHPEEMSRSTLLPWAQYWAWFLSGHAVSEVTSLGCHSDLWSPADGDFAPMARRRNWAARFAPLVPAGSVVGSLRPDLAKKTGLSPDVAIHAGLHDSNAALLAARSFPQIADHDATVLSTGTWFIAMRSLGHAATGRADPAALPEGRDCLVNVDASGRPVPSARFMGGREIESLIEIDTRRVDIKPDQPALLAAVASVLELDAHLLPGFAPGFGPYPQGEGRWVNRPEDWFARRALACLYAALVADTSLDLIGARDRLLVEGRFAEAEVFVRALASLRPGTTVYTANAHNDVSFGALRLIYPELRAKGELRIVRPLDADLDSYRSRWLSQLNRRG